MPGPKRDKLRRGMIPYGHDMNSRHLILNGMLCHVIWVSKNDVT